MTDPILVTAERIAVYTRQEVAARLDCSLWKVHQLVRDGYLVAVPGFRSRITVASFEAWLEGYDGRRGESNRTPPAKAAPSRRGLRGGLDVAMADLEAVL